MAGERPVKKETPEPEVKVLPVQELIGLFDLDPLIPE
jgi:hypothetical protein